MLIVKRPTAIVFGWNKPKGGYEFVTTVYSKEENNMQWVDLIACDVGDISYDGLSQFDVRYSPDVLVFIGTEHQQIHPYFDKRSIYFDKVPHDDEIANAVVVKTISLHSDPYAPFFSVFTPAFKTGDRIFRTYQGLKDQTEKDWEWVVVDDSPPDHNELWDNLQKIASEDFRVKPYRINPNTGGLVGLAKKRACSLSRGTWLVELDHDDYLLDHCLSKIRSASEKFPDAGFVYSDCTEMFEDGRFVKFDERVDWDFYGAENNHFNFGYSGHSWIDIKGKRYLQHHYPSINPITIRFNLSMPNHVRAWRSDVYKKIGGHRETLPLADDLELIIRSFIETRIIHIKDLLYVQYRDGYGTVNYNSFEINRISRLIKEEYNEAIHKRILELGFHDWEWDDEKRTNIHQEAIMKNDMSDMKFWEEEQVLNYIYE